MDCLAPPLNMVIHVQSRIRSGFSVRTALHIYIQDFPECSFARQINQWLFCLETGKPFHDPCLARQHYRKALLPILKRGLNGEPILEFLSLFEEELKEVCLQNLKTQVKKLAFLTLIPLFLFQVPAFFLLLLGPLLFELKSTLIH